MAISVYRNIQSLEAFDTRTVHMQACCVLVSLAKAMGKENEEAVPVLRETWQHTVLAQDAQPATSHKMYNQPHASNLISLLQLVSLQPFFRSFHLPGVGSIRVFELNCEEKRTQMASRIVFKPQGKRRRHFDQACGSNTWKHSTLCAE
eukprot:scpid82489/ scgid14681/ 